MREMMALTGLGWRVSVFRIRGAEHLEMNSTPMQLLPVMLRPFFWLRGLRWAICKRPLELRQMLRDVLSAKSFSTMLRLAVLLLTALGMAEYVVSRRLTFQCIRAHFLHSETVCAYWLAQLLDLPFSITIHTQMIYFPESLLRSALCKADFCVGISHETVALATRLRDGPEGVYLIRNGIDLTLLPKRSGIPDPAAAPLILAVGRLISKKGFDVLLKACLILRQRHIRFVCQIVGGGSEFVRLQKYITENDLGGYAQLLGALPFADVALAYQHAAILVAPSRICPDDVDGLPTVMIEALALGVPVIASDIAGIPDLIQDRHTGLLVPPDDEFALAHAIQILLDDPALRQQLSASGQKEVLQNFDIAQTIQHLNDAMRFVG